MREVVVPPDGADANAAPRRLHPATMLVALGRRAPSTLLGLPALLAAFSRVELGLLLGGAATILLVAALFRWIGWRRFTYALARDAVVIESGVFARNRRTIPYARVADVGIERRPLQRLFGLATVTLETGGAGENEGALDSVSLAEAERLRAVLRRRAGAADASATVDPGQPGSRPRSDAATIFAMDARRVFHWGLFNFSLVLIALGFGALRFLDDLIGVDGDALWAAIVERTGVARSLPLLAWAGAAAGAALLVLMVGAAAGVIRTTLRDHGYRLDAEPGRFRRTRGLFTRNEAIIALPRVQLAAIDTGPVRRRLGWSRLRAQLLGGEGEGGRQDLAPFARANEVDRLLTLLRLDRCDPGAMAPVSRGHVWRALLRQVGLPALLILGAAPFFPAVLLAAPLLLPLLATALLHRRHHRYRIASGLLHVQRGVIGRTMWILPTARIQAVTLRRSWLQRRLGLATLLVATAGGGRSTGPDIHDLREADAWTLMAELRPPA